jgi:predicted SnoaL-like aldol condensation-catalyzing enzyme
MMTTTHETKNRAFVLEAFDTLSNKRDYERAATFWSPGYVQHSAHIAAGRDGLFELTKALPSTLRYESAHAAADGEFVILHGRFAGHGLPRNWVVADVVRLENGLMVEHWDVIQDEATAAESKSGLPMFGTEFAPAETMSVSEEADGHVK